MNLAEFFHMGGYALYVWTSYALAAVVLVANLAVPLIERRRARRELVGRFRREGRL